MTPSFDMTPTMTSLAAVKPTVDLAMFGSLVLTPMLFLFMPLRKAMVTAYCLLWMFLPVAVIQLPGLPQLSKPAAISVGVFIALVLFYADRLVQKYRFRWFDIPVVLFGLIIPATSAMVNGLGVDGALFETLNAMFLWVVPYFAGRIILGDEMGVETIAVGIFFAALIYTPFAWYEMFFSPQLHRKTYGFHQHEFKQTKRGWSYRPMVFMTHGLMTSMWLVAGSVCGIWLHKAKRLKWKYPGTPLMAVGFLTFTAAVSNSMGAVLLLFVALAVLFSTRLVSPAWVLVPLLVVTPAYIFARSTGVLETDELVGMVRPINENRALSLEHRMLAEDAYVEKGSEKPYIGWGGYGKHRPVDPETGKLYTADGLWIIVYGKNGMIGIVAMVFTLLAVPCAIVFGQTTRVWRHPRFAATAALTVLLCIYSIDNLLNAMINPIYMLVLGSLATFATRPLAQRFRQRRRRRSARPAEPQDRAADDAEAEDVYDRPVGVAT